MAQTSGEKSHTIGEFAWNVTVALGALILLGVGLEAITD